MIVVEVMRIEMIKMRDGKKEYNERHMLPKPVGQLDR